MGQNQVCYVQVHQLECKYHELYTPIYSKRTTITTGDHEPTDAEAEWPSDSEDEDEGLSEEVENLIFVTITFLFFSWFKRLFHQVKEKAKLDEANKNEDVKGIPSFWLTIFKNVEMLAEMVQEADEPVLESLTDITVTFSEKDPMGFTLHFHFASNQFFTNSILTKCYEMKCEPPEDDPFSFEVSNPKQLHKHLIILYTGP